MPFRLDFATQQAMARAFAKLPARWSYPKRFQKKRSATPEGCAKVPPKEEVLEDMRRHL